MQPAVRAYWDAHDRLVVDGSLIFKGDRMVISVCLRAELMAVIHVSHMEIEWCLYHAWECLYWPRMSQDLKKIISTCDVCQTHQPSLQKEPLLKHEVIMRPWAKIGVDLCQLHGHMLHMVCNYFSNYLEVECHLSTTSQSRARMLASLFARCGIADVVVSDNNPQFASTEFASFIKK